jgi:AcrR family transcriptional regulator
MSCPHLAPVDPRITRTRNLLENSVRELMRERQFTEISVMDIAQKATVNRATFYAHYPDKHALLVSVIKADFRAHMQVCTATFPSFDAKGLHTIAVGVIEFVSEFASGCPAAAQDMAPSLPIAIQEETFEFLRAWLESGHFAETNGRLKDTATILSWSLFGIAYQWSKGERKRRIETVADSFVHVFRQGIALSAP